MSIEVNNESGVDLGAAGLDEAAIAELARLVLDERGVNPLAELSVLLVDEAAMTTLHEQWMDLPGPTDVMSFPMDTLPGTPGPAPSPGSRPPDDPGPTLLGDVVLCPAVARTQAEAAGHSVASELALLTAHGVLHLLGYDHGTEDEEKEMFGLQTELLRSWTALGHPAVRTPVPGTGGVTRQ